MGYRYGFKTEANNLAREVRAELKLGVLDRLEPRNLSTLLKIPIISLTELATDASAISYLIKNEPEVFSAMTVFRGSRRVIVHNDGHSAPRQNSNLAHELAHALLLHPPSVAFDSRGCRYWNQDIEDEANWLSGILLVTEEATIAIAIGQLSLHDAAWSLGVSNQMIRFRMNATGANKRVKRARGGR